MRAPQNKGARVFVVCSLWSHLASWHICFESSRLARVDRRGLQISEGTPQHQTPVSWSNSILNLRIVAFSTSRWQKRKRRRRLGGPPEQNVRVKHRSKRNLFNLSQKETSPLEKLTSILNSAAAKPRFAPFQATLQKTENHITALD